MPDRGQQPTDSWVMLLSPPRPDTLSSGILENLLLIRSVMRPFFGAAAAAISIVMQDRRGNKVTMIKNRTK